MKESICFVAASEITITSFFVSHLRTLSEKYAVSVVVNTNNKGFLEPFGINVTVIPVGLERKISFVRDLRALISLWLLFWKKKYDVVHSMTPKAGLLAMIAAYFAHIPLRVHTFTGQVWATRVGVARWFFKGFDRLIVSSATHILVDSYSQKDFLISEKVVQAAKAQVLANGSICGVNTSRFLPNLAAREIVRKELGIDESAILFLYLGRLAEDKGLLDLAAAFQRLNERFDEVHFLIVGPDEEGMKHRMTRLCEVCLERLHFVDFTATPENFMAAADVFCLASYREGFGMAVIEAAAVGIPAIATRIYGVTDAVDDNVTGFLYEPRNVNELTEKMLRMVKDPQMRLEMGRKARERVIRLYSAENVSSAFLAFYQSVLAPQ
jgi:glycosyltransferase involved in cell wall biosynthesis